MEGQNLNFGAKLGNKFELGILMESIISKNQNSHWNFFSYMLDFTPKFPSRIFLFCNPNFIIGSWDRFC